MEVSKATVSSYQSMTTLDLEYQAWLKEWGHIDFGHLKFLPEIKDKVQLMAYSKLRNMQADRRKRTMQIYKGRSIKEIQQNP